IVIGAGAARAVAPSTGKVRRTIAKRRRRRRMEDLRATARSASLGIVGEEPLRELLRRLDQPRVLEALGELLGVDQLEPDLDARVAVVVRRREVDLRVR